MATKTLLCYGDSNTFGYLPSPEGARLARAERWPHVLGERLAHDHGLPVEMISEGMPGRTTVLDDAYGGGHRNGLRYLLPCLESHRPLDLVTLMLGTNDLKARFCASPADIALGVERLLKVIMTAGAGIDGRAPKVLLIAPVPVEELAEQEGQLAGAAAKSRRLAPLYAELAEAYGAAFFDAGSVARVSPLDGIHYGADQHRRLGEALAPPVARQLADPPPPTWA